MCAVPCAGASGGSVSLVPTIARVGADAEGMEVGGEEVLNRPSQGGWARLASSGLCSRLGSARTLACVPFPRRQVP